MGASGNARFLGSSLTGGVYEQRDLMEHIYQFYQGMMGSEGESRRFALGQHLWDDNQRVSDRENHD
jgi:hypothetical protein